MKETRHIMIIKAERTGYAPDQCRTCTVGDLIDMLKEYDEDMEIYLSHDHGYTYGGINYANIYEAECDDETGEVEPY